MTCHRVDLIDVHFALANKPSDSLDGLLLFIKVHQLLLQQIKDGAPPAQPHVNQCTSVQCACRTSQDSGSQVCCAVISRTAHPEGGGLKPFQVKSSSSCLLLFTPACADSIPENCSLGTKHQHKQGRPSLPTCQSKCRCHACGGDVVMRLKSAEQTRQSDRDWRANGFISRLLHGLSNVFSRYRYTALQTHAHGPCCSVYLVWVAEMGERSILHTTSTANSRLTALPSTVQK